MPLIHFEVDLHDGASPALEQIVQQARASGVEISDSFKPATAALNQHAEAAGTLTGVIRQERQEHRMGMFAAREAGMAITQLTGDESGLAKEINTGVGTVFSMSFALSAMRAEAEKIPGSLGQIAKSVGGLVLPVAAGIAAFALLVHSMAAVDKEWDADGKAIEDNKNKILGIVPAISTLRDEQTKATEEAGKQSFAAHALNLALTGTATESIAAIFGIDLHSEAEVKARKETKAWTESEVGIQEALKKEREETEKGVVEVNAFNVAWAEMNDLKRRGADVTGTRGLESELVNAKELLKVAEEDKHLREDTSVIKQWTTEQVEAYNKVLAARNHVRDAERAIHDQEVADEKAALDQENADDEVRKARQSAIAIAQINLDKSVKENHALAADDKVRIDAKAEMDILNIEEQAAIREEFLKHQQDGDFKAIDTQYALKRQTLEQQTQNKIEAIWAKEVDEHKKDTSLMAKAQEEVTTSLRTGFGNAIGEAIVNAQNFGDAFVAVGKRIVEQLITMVAEAAIFDALMSFFSGGTTDIGALVGKYSASLSPGGGIPSPIPESAGGFSAPISNGANSFQGSVRQSNDGQSSQNGTTIVFNVSALDTKSFTDYVKQGSVSDAIMTVVRRTVQTGR